MRTAVSSPRSALLPLPDVPGLVVERTQARAGQALRLGTGALAVHQRDVRVILDDEVVELLPHRRGLLWAQLDQHLIEQLVEVVVLPLQAVAASPVVRL